MKRIFVLVKDLLPLASALVSNLKGRKFTDAASIVMHMLGSVIEATDNEPKSIGVIAADVSRSLKRLVGQSNIILHTDMATALLAAYDQSSLAIYGPKFDDMMNAKESSLAIERIKYLKVLKSSPTLSLLGWTPISPDSAGLIACGGGCFIFVLIGKGRLYDCPTVSYCNWEGLYSLLGEGMFIFPSKAMSGICSDMIERIIVSSDACISDVSTSPAIISTYIASGKTTEDPISDSHFGITSSKIRVPSGDGRIMDTVEIRFSSLNGQFR